MRTRELALGLAGMLVVATLATGCHAKHEQEQATQAAALRAEAAAARAEDAARRVEAAAGRVEAAADRAEALVQRAESGTRRWRK